MEYVSYVSFTTYRRATVMTRLYFKSLMFMQMLYKKKKKKKNGSSHLSSYVDIRN